MPLDLWWVETPAAGRVGVVQRPRGGDWLAHDFAFLRGEGVDLVVSALGDKETRKSWLEDAHLHAEAVGLAYLRLPIPNLLTPGPEFRPALHELAGRVRRGEAVVAHCFACVGRSPLIAASMLALLGVEPGEAWRRVERARGCAVPDTLAQRLWVWGLIGA
jgi:protein-tyrosine phosphatase